MCELEECLCSKPLFIPPLDIKALESTIAITHGTPKKVKKEAKLWNGIRSYVTVNINKRLGIIEEAWGISLHLNNLSKRIASFYEYLKKYLDHDRKFIENDLMNFINKIDTLSNF